MAKIKFGDQHNKSQFHLKVVTTGASETEIDAGEQYDRSSREAHIVDLPANIDLERLAAELSRLPLPAVDGATVAAAQKAAIDGDRGNVARILRNLGASAWEIAKKAGADMAAAAIKASLGLK
jgi:hypothetical protein